MERKDRKGRTLRTGEEQMPNKRYRFRYTDLNGNRQMVYSWKLTPSDKVPKGKPDDLSLREKEAKIEEDKTNGIVTDRNIRVHMQVKHYIDTKGDIANSTKENYLYIYKNHIKESSFGNLILSQVKKSDVLVYYNHLSIDCKFKNGTIQLVHNILFPSFQLAINDDLIRKNPCTGCMKNYPQSGLLSEKEPFTFEQQKKLVEFLRHDRTYQQYYALVVFALGTGCRIGEIMGLTWDDIDLAAKTVNINHQMIYKKKDGKYKFYIAPTKNKTNRCIPLIDDVVDVLKEHKEETYFKSISSGNNVDGYCNFVFLSDSSSIRKPATINRAFNSLTATYNKREKEAAIKEKRNPVVLPHFSAHILRHTACTRMAEKNIDVRVLQYIMGHKNIAVTMSIYNHVNDNRVQREVGKLQEILMG